MPYVNIQVTKEGGTHNVGPTDEQKRLLIAGVTELLQNVLNKDPKTTHVVISEVALANWGVGGVPVIDYRAQNKESI
ncbi:tautomerase family protein [Pseudoalteromonas spongiae]|uniref:tautomerase family protein n=1 Tax=Pseudoalteromonas spongiae TaxID=298657 RepID=UPI00026CCD36|nr:4-oxalocrotonate tautomerase family protein [Pseudoalteromonas spongiae]ATD00257.1 4-oxalocrotonate tautomerase [Pseudoalteromonas spongiae UST010723-006]